MKYFTFYVLPFYLGIVLLVVFSVYKYWRWTRGFNKAQHIIIRKNLLSWRFLGAVWEAFRESLLHWHITRRRPLLGYMHRSLAFGWFLLIVVGAVQADLAFPKGHPFFMGIFYNYFVHSDNTFPQAMFFANLMDGLLLYVFSGLLLAMLKRVWSRPLGMRHKTRHNLIDRVAKFALWAIFPLRFLSETVTSAIYGNGGFLIHNSGALAAELGLTSPLLEYMLWSCYAVALGVFFSLMPFTRYMHIFTEPMLIFFRRHGVKENPDKKNGFTLFELSACARCGLCIDPCPMSKQLGVRNMQGVYLLQNVRAHDIKRKEDSIAENCMMCDRCMVECPVGIDLNSIRQQVRTKNKRAIDTPDNYHYLDNIHPFNAIGRVAYFGGCMSHLTPGIPEAMKEIFDAVGQRYWYMDEEASICCGKPLMQQGFTQQASELRRRNTELIANSHANMLVTSCPICYQTFTKQYHLSIPVMHHTEYIASLIESGRLPLTKSTLQATYHDPCELGRGCGIYDQPRKVLQSCLNLVDTEHQKEDSMCCGFNLGNTVTDLEQQTLIRDAAMENLTKPKPDLIATACPMCKKAFTRGETFPVKDVAEIVAQQLKRSPRPSNQD